MASFDLASEEFPKPILYTGWPTSVWSTVLRLCLTEMGYGEEEYVLKQVDISKGENFSPSYLKINRNGTIPTLLVPVPETYRVERQQALPTLMISEFLGRAARGTFLTRTSHTLSERPVPALTPETIEDEALSDNLISMVHLPTVDPNFLALAASDSQELEVKAKGWEGEMLSSRKEALQKHIAEAQRLAKKAVAEGKSKDGNESATDDQKMVAFLKEKAAANELLWEVYFGRVGSDRENAFFGVSKKAWAYWVPDTLLKLGEGMKGPYTLGDHVSLADLHIIAWLTRLVFLAGGTPSADGVNKLRTKSGGKMINKKVRAFWASWMNRESFRRE